jgi:hypothetical protein
MVLDRHSVEYLLVGGVSATAYGAQRVTTDFDCLPARNEDNLRRLATAMAELNARLRVEGLSDEEARQLPVQLDAAMLGSMEISTWRTDAGDLDILGDMPARDGKRQRYEDLAPNATEFVISSVTVRAAALDDVIASKQWANRHKDHEALAELHELQSSRSGSSPDPSASSTPSRPTTAGPRPYGDLESPTAPESGIDR